MASDTRAWDVLAALSRSALVASAVAGSAGSSSMARGGEMRWSTPGSQAEEVLALTGKTLRKSKETTDDTIHWIGRACQQQHLWRAWEISMREVCVVSKREAPPFSLHHNISLSLYPSEFILPIRCCLSPQEEMYPDYPLSRSIVLNASVNTGSRS